MATVNVPKTPQHTRAQVVDPLRWDDGIVSAQESGDFGTAQDLAREAELLEKKLQTLRLAQGRIARDTERLATAIRSLRTVAVRS
jgi:hypothetical protein